jgi:hypothetical protein
MFRAQAYGTQSLLASAIYVPDLRQLDMFPVESQSMFSSLGFSAQHRIDTPVALLAIGSW